METQEALTCAEEAASTPMSSLHVLLGLVLKDHFTAARWLDEHGIDLPRFREVLKGAIQLHPSEGDIDFTKLLAEAERQRPVEEIRTVDLLEELRYGSCDCAAGKFLASAGVSAQSPDSPGPAGA